MATRFDTGHKPVTASPPLPQPKSTWTFHYHALLSSEFPLTGIYQGKLESGNLKVVKKLGNLKNLDKSGNFNILSAGKFTHVMIHV